MKLPLRTMSLIFASTAWIGCFDGQSERAAQIGRLEMQLSGTSAAGVEYQLRAGTFHITGKADVVVSTDEDPATDAMSVELEAGEYSIELLPGWHLEQALPDGSLKPVQALLASSNPVAFTIRERRSTNVRFRFKTWDDMLEIGNGRVVIGIDVIHELRDAGSESDAAVDGGTCADGYHAVSTGDCRKVLFQDTFDDGVVSSDWLLWRKGFLEVGGQMLVGDQPRIGFNYGHGGSGRDAVLITHIGEQAWRDYRVDMDVLVRPPNAYNPYGLPSCMRYFGIWFRTQEAQESWNAPKTTSYAVTFNPQPANCVVGGSTWVAGHVALATLHDYFLTGTGCCNADPGFVGRTLIDTTTPAPFSDGFNHYAIEAVGSSVKFWINDTLVFDYMDNAVPYTGGATPILFGGIAVTWGWEQIGAVDNVVVTDMR